MNRECKNCTKADNCPWRTPEDIICYGYNQKPMTNADRIRSMTDEELAEWFDGDLPSKPKEWWIDWLKEESPSE